MVPKEMTDIMLFSAKDLSFYSAPQEDGTSFLENAWIKAKAMKPLTPPTDWLIAEDSGIEVEALDGLPGIHSARYAGNSSSDMMNNDKLLKMLNFKSNGSRKARYFCQIVALGPKGQSFEASGECTGSIANGFSGSGGFGYDPIFIPNGFECSMAEISLKEKNKISHRKKAFTKFLSQLDS